MLLIVIDTSDSSRIALGKDQAVREMNAIIFLPERELYILILQHVLTVRTELTASAYPYADEEILEIRA